jgi:hypothetical protein
MSNRSATAVVGTDDEIAAAARSVMEATTWVLLAWIRRTGWPDYTGAASPSDINHGRCVEWAEFVCASVPGAVMAEWDDPPSGLLHTFVYWRGRYYDADCLDGVDSADRLPILRDPVFDNPRGPEPGQPVLL